MTTHPVIQATYSHIGVCVTDLEKSKAFYNNALGFSEGAVFEANNQVNALLGLNGNVEMVSQMMTLGSFTIELIYFKDPKAFSSGQLRAMNQLGLTHLSFIVEDVDAAAKHLEACGATILHDTRSTVDFPGSEPTVLVFCTDPDGTRIELYKPSSGWQS